MSKLKSGTAGKMHQQYHGPPAGINVHCSEQGCTAKLSGGTRIWWSRVTPITNIFDFLSRASVIYKVVRPANRSLIPQLEFCFQLTRDLS